MAFLGDIGKIFFGGASTQDVVQTSALMAGTSLPTAVALGKGAGMIAEDISRIPRQSEPTQTTTVQSAQGPTMVQPAMAVEFNPIGTQDTGGVMPAMYRPPMPPSQPSMMGGVQQANVLKFAPAVGGAVVGFAADFITDLLTGEQKKMIITRKLKRETEDLMEIFQNDMRQVALQLSKMKGKQYTEENVLKILLHKFTNQGPYVTKAAVRKTRKTVRKLDTLKKLHADICGRATPARRRAAPRRAAGAQLLQVKN